MTETWHRPAVRMAGILLCAWAAAQPAVLRGEPPAGAGSELCRTLEGRGYTCVEMERFESGYLAVRVKLSDRPLLLLLDTGAAQTHLDPRRTEGLGLEWVRPDRADEHCRVKGLEVGPLSTGPWVIFKSDMGDYNLRTREWGDPPADGVLGGDVLEELSGVIDYANARLFLKPNTPRGEPPAKAGTDLRRVLERQGYVCVELERFESGYLAVRVKIADRPLLLILDTGAAQAHLDRRRTEGLGLEWTSPWEDSADAYGRVKGLEVGPLSTGPWVIFTHDMGDYNRRTREWGDPPADGVLGGDVLKEFSGVIDYANARLYLKTKSP